jgi:hypothetical protein
MSWWELVKSLPRESLAGTRVAKAVPPRSMEITTS